MQSQLYYLELLNILDRGIPSEEDFRAKLAEYSAYADTLELRVQGLKTVNRNMTEALDDVDSEMDDAEPGRHSRRMAERSARNRLSSLSRINKSAEDTANVIRILSNDTN